MDPLIVFLQAAISGISIGCIYTLVALGFARSLPLPIRVKREMIAASPRAA